MQSPQSAMHEWRSYWPLPFAAALGYATAVIYVYSMGPFIEPIQKEFGWSRAQISSGITIAAFFSAILSIPVGIMVDRIGPRRVGLAGVLLMCGSLSLLGTATGSKTNWFVLWGILAFSTLWVQATVWASAVNSRFVTSRGLALAVTLSGASVSATIFPLMATWLIEQSDWRTAYMAMGGIWALVVFPFMFFCFRGANDRSRKESTEKKQDTSELTGLTIAEGIRSATLYKLIIVAGFFSFTAVGTFVHFVPILKDSGTEAYAAAGVAALVGIFSIIGRFGTGFLLDRFRGHIIGGLATLLPIIGSALLIYDGANPVSQSIAAAIFGLTLGAEVDVIAYLAAKYFGMKNFGALYGAMVMSLSLGTAFGPLGAGAVYDHFGSYEEFLVLNAILMAISTIAFFSMGRAPTADEYEKQRSIA